VGIDFHTLGVGRALYISRENSLYIARRYHIYRSDDGGNTWRLDCYVPSAGWKPLAAKIRLAARLLRYAIAAMEVLPDGTRIAVARDGIYRAAPGETRMTRVFQITRGSRPLNLAVDGNRVLFGEYGDAYRDCEAFIYVSEDGGKTFDVGYRFPAGSIRHVHGVQVDPHQDGYWVLVGDSDQQSGIGVLSKDLRTLEWLNRGSQQCRAVRVLIEPDCLVYGTDSDREKNFIVRMDKKSGEISRILPVEGSSLHAAAFGPVRAVSTCVEPNPESPLRECSLYASWGNCEWRRVATYQKDRHHPTLFQFGTLVLPYAYGDEPCGIFSGQAVKLGDDRVSFVEFSPKE